MSTSEYLDWTEAIFDKKVKSNTEKKVKNYR